MVSVVGPNLKTSKVIKTFVCENCGVETRRRRSDQKYCSARECRLLSNNGPRKPRVRITCPHCEKVVVRRNSRQVTCGARRCQGKNQLINHRKARPLKRTGKVISCVYCRAKVVQIAVNHTTCGSDACRKARHRDRENESFWLKRRREPVICGVCGRPIKVKRLRLHPACSKQLANDKKRLRRTREKLTAAKVAAHKQQEPPKQRDRISPRMEELKCVRQLQRTS